MNTSIKSQETTSLESKKQEHNRCIVCESNNIEILYSKVKDLEYKTYKDVNYALCKVCGLIFQSPLPTEEVLPSFYPDEYRNYLPEKSSLFSTLKKMQFNNLAKKIAHYFNKESKLLDIGFGNGQLLLALQRLGHTKLYGTDFTDKVFPSLQNSGIALEVSNVEKKVPFDETFDVIFMNNVIEHFLDPVKVLENCKNKLTKNGKIILITPNTNTLEFSIFKSYWAGFHAPRHTFLFNTKNLKMLGDKLGFNAINIYPMTDPGQWSISIQNILQSSSFTSTRLKSGMTWYLTALSIACMPVALIQNFFNNSTSIMCVLER